MGTLPERLPYRVSASALANRGVESLPVSILLDQVRSLYNVGAFFRIADAAGLASLYLCGITGHPPKKALTKTALGAEKIVPWEHHWDALPLLERLRAAGVELAAVETSPRASDLYDWQPRFPVCLIFGHEVEGVRPEISERCDSHLRIPMLGVKHSLNVAVAGGVAAYELLRKYRSLVRNTQAPR